MSKIKVENLSKIFYRQKREAGFAGAMKSLFNRDYEEKIAVENISFDVNQGEVVGYIGPNGAGKSTTIKMLVGILVPTSGTIEVNGLVPYENRIENAKKMGVVFGHRTQLWWDIPVSESFTLMKYMYKIPEKQYKKNIDLFSDVLGISEFINIPVRQLSLGQRMRADICASLLHNPDVLYLDEPTIGLDVVVKENIRKFIKEINNERNTTVILTTHDMLDIEKLCSRVIVIDNGSIMYDGGLQTLRDKYGFEEVLYAELVEPLCNLEQLYNLGVDKIELDNNKLLIKYNKQKTNSSKILSFLMDKTKVTDFKVKETEIDEVIRNIYSNFCERVKT